MKVILLERLGDRGAPGDVVTVRDGFARNYLLPRNKALRANVANLAGFEAQRTMIEARAAVGLKTAKALADRAKDVSIFLIAQAAASGQLYGNIRPRQIANALAAQGIPIRSEQVALPSPIRGVGRHVVKLHLHPDVIVDIDVLVGRTEDEFADVGVAHLSGEERHDRALAVLESLALTGTPGDDATEPLVKVAQFADDDAGERAWQAVRKGSSSDFEDIVKEVLKRLEVNCLVSLRGDLDERDASLIHMHMDFQGALPTRLGNDRTFRLLSSEVIDGATMDLSLFAVNAAPTGDVERQVFRAPDGEIGRVRLSRTLKRVAEPLGEEPLEVWAMAQVNGACVHRRVWSFG